MFEPRLNCPPYYGVALVLDDVGAGVVVDVLSGTNPSRGLGIRDEAAALVLLLDDGMHCSSVFSRPIRIGLEMLSEVL